MELKIPESIKVAGKSYKIVKTKHPITIDGLECYGKISFENSEIELSETLQDVQERLITFLHELLHAICHDRDIEQDEKIIDSIAKGLYDVLTNWEN